MLLGHRSFLVAVFSLQLLSACSAWNPTSAGSESGTIAPPGSSGSTPGNVPPPKAGPGGGDPNANDDAVAATTSIAGTLSVTAGASQTVTVSFTTSDGLPISGFAVSGSLGALPTGWSGPGTFTCAAVGPGSGCSFTLTYRTGRGRQRHADPRLRVCRQRGLAEDAGTLCHADLCGDGTQQCRRLIFRRPARSMQWSARQ